MRLKAHASVADSKWAAIKHQVHQALRVKRTIGWKIPKAETAWGVEYEGRDEAENSSAYQSIQQTSINQERRSQRRWETAGHQEMVDSESLKELATPMSCTKGCR